MFCTATLWREYLFLYCDPGIGALLYRNLDQMAPIIVQKFRPNGSNKQIVQEFRTNGSNKHASAPRTMEEYSFSGWCIESVPSKRSLCVCLIGSTGVQCFPLNLLSMSLASPLTLHHWTHLTALHTSGRSLSPRWCSVGRLGQGWFCFVPLFHTDAPGDCFRDTGLKIFLVTGVF